MESSTWTGTGRHFWMAPLSLPECSSAAREARQVWSPAVVWCAGCYSHAKYLRRSTFHLTRALPCAAPPRPALT